MNETDIRSRDNRPHGRPRRTALAGMFGLGALALSGFAASSTVAAQAPRTPAAPVFAGSPIVLVMEAGDVSYDPVGIRTALTTELHRPVVSMGDAIGAPTEGTLAVSVSDGGRAAAIQFVPTDDQTQRVSLRIHIDRRGDASGSWLVAPCAAAIRTSENSRGELAVGEDRHRGSGDSERFVAVDDVVDPWIRRPSRRQRVTWLELQLGDEIVNPWTGRVETPATGAR